MLVEAPSPAVMAGPAAGRIPAIHGFADRFVDGRVKPGHDACRARVSLSPSRRELREHCFEMRRGVC
jgi:hypothetical protein